MLKEYAIRIVPINKEHFIQERKVSKLFVQHFQMGKRHDFRLFKESKTNINPDIKAITDPLLWYQGIQKLCSNSKIAKEEEKENPINKRREEEKPRIYYQKSGKRKCHRDAQTI